MNDPSAWGWILPILLAIVYGVAAWFVYQWVEVIVARRMRRRSSLWDDILASSLGWPLVMLLVLGGALMLFSLWPMAEPKRLFYHGIEKIIFSASTRSRAATR